MKAQSLEIEQLQRDLERAQSVNESMRDELEQLKGEVPKDESDVRSREGRASPESGGPSEQRRSDALSDDRGQE